MDGTKKISPVHKILKGAAYARKKDYRVYNSYKSEIEALDLPQDEYETAMRMLIGILKV